MFSVYLEGHMFQEMRHAIGRGRLVPGARIDPQAHSQSLVPVCVYVGVCG